MLVSRAFRESALQVFFSRNRFIVMAEWDGRFLHAWDHHYIAPPRLPVSKFLRDVVPEDALRHMRHLEVVFTPFEDRNPSPYCALGSPCHADWLDTLITLKDKLTLSALTIDIHFKHLISPLAPLDKRQFSERHFATKAVFMRVIGPMRHWRGLARFFMRLVSSPSKPYLPDWEKEIEKAVMGPDYDAVAVGKGNGEFARWRWSHMVY